MAELQKVQDARLETIRRYLRLEKSLDDSADTIRALVKKEAAL